MYLLADGDVYLGKHNNNYVPTKNKKDAVKFETKVVATNICTSSVPKILRKNYDWKIVEVKEDNKEVIDVKIAATNKVDSRYTYVDTNDLTSTINELSGKFSVLRGNKEWLLERESNLDKQICDILHWIEFNNFSACEGYKLCKALKNLRLERRKVKNELELINIINMHTCDHIANGNTSKAIAGLDSKQYEPRVLSDLFKTRKVDDIYHKFN